MSRARKWTLILLGFLAVVIVALGVAAWFIVRSPWFHEKVRTRIVAEVEKATGGRAELGAFRFDYHTLTAHVDRFVLHGKEAADRAPLFRTEHLAVGITIVSALRRDIYVASIDIDRPEVNIYIAEDGSNNIPAPKIRRGPSRTATEQLIRLAARRVALRNGYVQVDDRKVPVDVRAERVQLALDYQFPPVPGGDARYTGRFTTDPVWVHTEGIEPLALQSSVAVTLEKNRVLIDDARLRMKDSNIQARGTIEDLRKPRVQFLFGADVAVADVGQQLHLPIVHTGRARASGKLSLGDQLPFSLSATVHGTGLAYHRGRVDIRGAVMNGEVRLLDKELEVDGLHLQALGGDYRGKVVMHDFRRFTITGQASGMPVARLAEMEGTKLAWNGTANGPVDVVGSIEHGSLRGVKVNGRVVVTPAEGAVPVQGTIELAYDQRNDLLSLGQTQLSTPVTQISATGTLGQTLNLRVVTKDLNDILPLIGIVAAKPPESLPVTLKNGSAQFEGTVTGKTSDPVVAGKLLVTGFEFEKRYFDRLSADVTVQRNGINVRNLALAQNGMRLEGQGDIATTDFKPLDSSPITARLALRHGELSRLVAETGATIPVKGTVEADAIVSGTYGNPEASATITASQVSAWEERFDRARAQVRYTDGAIEIVSSVVELGPARLNLTGIYKHPSGDWNDGELRFDLAGTGLTLAQSGTIRKMRPGLEGNVKLKASGTVRAAKTGSLLTSLNGTLEVAALSVSGKPTGNFTLTAATKGDELAVRISGDLRGSAIDGGGEFRLARDYPGKARLKFSPITLATINDLIPGERKLLPVEGRLEGSAAIAGPVLKPEDLKGRIEITRLEIGPSPNDRIKTPAQRAELTVQNVAPVVLDVDGRAIRVRSLVLAGQGTQLEAAGAFAYQGKTPWDLRISGTLNLAALRTFNSDILASGGSVIEATVRGSADKPVLTGRLELKNASLYIEDVPNGVDNANGVIIFDANRATIEKLTAQTGGGNVAVTGFVGFGGDEMIYRLQAKLDRVRVRYPEGVSTTVNANLALGGTTTRSLLSGPVTIIRLGFNPRTDVGSLLAESARPGPPPAAGNPFLQGMLFDVRIETSPNVEFQTSYTRDIQGEADLRLRGSPARPVLLGRVNVSQGEINFFGNKYTISHGEISFFNPAKIEPVLNLDLESRVRGVVVTLHFAGPVSKMNVSYRSDPPLASQDIVALLAVGRAPDTASIASGQTVSNPSVLQAGTNSLLGQALAAPVSSRLQRFFGVSRLKIDPQLTTLENTPQARLTIEQQISTDITLTYITNLANAQQQIVRLEWNMNKNWSVVAVREENGLFGIDFLYRKRFK